MFPIAVRLAEWRSTIRSRQSLLRLCFSGCLLLLIALLIALLTVLLTPPAQAQDAAALPDQSRLAQIELTHLKQRYALASVKHSSGFMPAPAGVALEDALPYLAERSLDTFSLRPDFSRHNRYWLYTTAINLSATTDWMLHVSNLGLKSPRILLHSGDQQWLYQLGNSDRSAQTDINPLGRAVAVSLPAGKPVSIVLELNADRVVWTPYLALISAAEYNHWSHLLELAYLLALGIILGMIALALACWMITRQATFFWAALASATMLIYYLQHSYLLAVFGYTDYNLRQNFWHVATLTMLAQLAFAASFLQISRRSGWWFYTFAGSATLTVMVWLLSQFIPVAYKLPLFVLNYALLWLVVISSGVVKIRLEGNYYVYYLLGWLPPLLSIFHSIVVTLSLQPAPDQIEPSYKLISTLYIQIVHIFLHAMALILRIQKLRADKLRSEFLSNAKSRFIAQSSHDLSQPLNSMGIFLEFLKPHVSQLDGKKILQRLADTHRQMSVSFKSIMDLGKLEAGAYQTNVKPLALNPVLHRLHREYQILALQKGLQLKFQFTTLWVLSDEELLERMLRNLLSNAIKYTDSGKVLIGCRRRGSQVAIEVLDSGRGIDLALQQHIFDIYQRTDREEAAVSGYGIGLSIVRHLSELLAHPVQLESEPGRGSQFRILVPRAATPSLTQGDAQPLAETRPEIALVMQQRELQQHYRTQLQAWSFVVHEFDSLAAASRSSQPVAMLFSDSASLTHTALSASELATLAQRQLCAALCATDAVLPEHWLALVTPLRPAQLRAVLNTALRRQAQTPAEFKPVSP